MMKKTMFSVLLVTLPLAVMAQDDDMYFVPSKKSAVRATVGNDGPTSTYYSGSNRSVDDYNRRGGSYYQVIANDTTGNDIIDFSAEQGVYPDSAQTEDFALTRQMSRWDGYTPAETYWQGYSDGREDALGWHSPWYYSSFYPWYDSYWYWHDPWYYRHYGWYSPWYDPWYYGGYYWHHPYWYGGYHYTFHGGGSGRGGLYARNGNTGTIDLRGGSRGRFSSTSTTRRSTSSSTARATTPVRSTSGNFNRTSSTNNNNSNFNRSSSVNSSSSSGSFSRSSSGGGFSGGGGSRSGGISRGRR